MFSGECFLQYFHLERCGNRAAQEEQLRLLANQTFEDEEDEEYEDDEDEEDEDEDEEDDEEEDGEGGEDEEDVAIVQLKRGN